MKILVNDYGAYAFPFELSAELATQGNTVLHSYCVSLNATPNGCYFGDGQIPHGLHILPLKLEHTFQKSSLWRRRQQDIEYGTLVASVVAKYRPDIVLSGNTPLDAQRLVLRVCQNQDAAFVFWLQDILSHAINFGLKKKFGPFGTAISQFYLHRERDLVRRSDYVISIAKEFDNILDSWGIDAANRRVIENWAPIRQFPSLPRNNVWSRARKIDDCFTFVYSGTLSLKHNPRLLAELAKATAQDGAKVILRSTGSGADYLRRVCESESISNLVIEDFGPFEETPLVHAAADVLIAVLEPGASQFSVPSKVMAYLCAQRPLLLAVPSQNPAAQLVRRECAGLVSEPDDIEGFISSAKKLMQSPQQRAMMAASGRRYADLTFKIDDIAERFQDIFDRILEKRRCRVQDNYRSRPETIVN